MEKVFFTEANKLHLVVIPRVICWFFASAEAVHEVERKSKKTQNTRARLRARNTHCSKHVARPHILRRSLRIHAAGHRRPSEWRPDRHRQCDCERHAHDKKPSCDKLVANVGQPSQNTDCRPVSYTHLTLPTTPYV